jgi:hypothetical protein
MNVQAAVFFAMSPLAEASPSHLADVRFGQALGYWVHGQVVPKLEHAAVIELCFGDTTSLPASPSALAWRFDATGTVAIEPGPADLVRQSVELVRRLAALSVSEEDERAVDELVRSRSRSLTGRSRPIERR